MLNIINDSKNVIFDETLSIGDIYNIYVISSSNHKLYYINTVITVYECPNLIIIFIP